MNSLGLLNEYFRQHHMVCSDERKEEIMAVCKQYEVFPFIKDIPHETKNGIRAIWWAYTDPRSQQIVSHPGWRQYLDYLGAFEGQQQVIPEKVYFIQAKEGGPIKIGVAQSPDIRLAQIQNMCPVPLRILATTDGGHEKEVQLHAQFADARLHGEWFIPTESLLALIKEVAQ